MARAQAGCTIQRSVTILCILGLTICAAAQRNTPAAGVRRLQSSGIQRNSNRYEDTNGGGSEFVAELDSLPRLLQEQMTEDAAVAAATAAAAQQSAGQAGDPSTPGAYGSDAGFDSLDAGNGVTITSMDDTEDPTSAGATSSTKATLEVAARDPARSVAGASGPVETRNEEGKVVEQLSSGQMAGIVVGVVIAAGVVALGVFGYQRRKKHRQADYISRYRQFDGEIEMH